MIGELFSVLTMAAIRCIFSRLLIGVRCMSKYFSGLIDRPVGALGFGLWLKDLDTSKLFWYQSRIWSRCSERLRIAKGLHLPVNVGSAEVDAEELHKERKANGEKCAN